MKFIRVVSLVIGLLITLKGGSQIISSDVPERLTETRIRVEQAQKELEQLHALQLDSRLARVETKLSILELEVGKLNTTTTSLFIGILLLLAEAILKYGITFKHGSKKTIGPTET